MSGYMVDFVSERPEVGPIRKIAEEFKETIEPAKGGEPKVAVRLPCIRSWVLTVAGGSITGSHYFTPTGGEVTDAKAGGKGYPVESIVEDSHLT